MEFFYATLMFAREHKFKDLSWRVWKPDGFYRFVSDHISKVSGFPQRKDPDQCKVKDQSLKNTWLPRLDLREVAFNSIEK